MTERRSVVYLLLCFGFPNQLRDLFRTLYHPADHYIFHCDTKAPPALRGLIDGIAAGFPNVHRIEDRLCSWGGYSLVDATLRGIDHALDAIPYWSHFVPLSEQHLPLCSADDIAEALRPGVSRLIAERVRTVDPVRRDLIFQRFAYRYRELPGVGCFAVRPANPPSDFLDRLHHGHQWIALARDACERLRGRDAYPDIMARMQASLIADETCIQTLLFGTRLVAGLKVHPLNPTYVASPEFGGRPDLIFTEENFACARQQKYLFIRKRPPRLPESVKQAVGSFAGLTTAELDARLAPHAHTQPPALIDSRDLEARFTAGLRLLRSDIAFLSPPADAGWLPRCFLRLRTPHMHPDLFLGVLSEDLHLFKLLLVWRPPGPRIDLPLEAGGYLTLMLQIRIGSVMHQREIYLPTSADQGFVSLRDDGDAEPLVHMAAAYLAVADRIRRLDGRGQRVVPCRPTAP